jgi:mannose-6-phosphate isomerase-like protein (cupin superfamily)
MSELSEKIDVLQLASVVEKEWVNFIAAHVDNYVVRVIVQETTSRWHHHARGDELFLVLQGEYAIDLEDRTIELRPGQMFAVPKLVTHRTRAIQRSVIVCFESATNDLLS